MPYPKTEPCEFCGNPITYGFVLCENCDDTVLFFDERSGPYELNNGEL